MTDQDSEPQVDLSGMEEKLVFKVASTGAEFEAIHRLNHRTFVKEIPQHEDTGDGRLVDKFHAENTYVICLLDGELIGMISVRDRRPFSLDGKMKNLDSHLPPFKSICEFRLLAIEKRYRGGPILRGLVAGLIEVCVERNYDLAVISGIVGRQGMYERLGFVAFGPRVGTEGAMYQPMYLSLDAFRTLTMGFLKRTRADGK